jgi:hypothetical protein
MSRTSWSPVPVSPETGGRAGPRGTSHRLHAGPAGSRARPCRARGPAENGRPSLRPVHRHSAHRAPTVVEASGLTAGGNDGWVAVDPGNLATRFPNVYALGDCADAPVPRAGVFAETAARAVADDIAAKLHGSGPINPYTARGRATSSSAQGSSARSTPTSCPDHHPPRRSSRHHENWPPRRTNSPPPGAGAGSAVEPTPWETWDGSLARGSRWVDGIRRRVGFGYLSSCLQV